MPKNIMKVMFGAGTDLSEGTVVSDSEVVCTHTHATPGPAGTCFSEYNCLKAAA